MMTYVDEQHETPKLWMELNQSIPTPILARRVGVFLVSI
jgi:hypothetical protein